MYCIAQIAVKTYNKAMIVVENNQKHVGRNQNEESLQKATATVTAAAMLASLTACGGGAASSATTAAPAADTKAEGGAETTEAAASGIDNKDIKIGVSIWSSTDVLGSQCKLILDEAAKGFRSTGSV